MKIKMYKLGSMLIIILANLLISSSIFAQSPEKMSYQAVVRDASNALVTTQMVGMQISILQGSAIGTPVYVETQTPTTNANGLVMVEIATGTVISGNFSAIDWTNGPYFIKTETDPTGGTTYTITGTSQLLSVPYALHAKMAENISGAIGIMQDADADTKIQVEETADEDIIRFDIAGTERWIMDGSRLEPKSTGYSVFIGEGAGFNDDLSSNRNAFVGYQTGYNNTTGYYNTASGYRALYNNTTGDRNTAYGYRALYSDTTGYRNTAIGYQALYYNTTGYYNTASGYMSLNRNTIGNNNTAYGTAANFYNQGGNNNVMIGYEAGRGSSSHSKSGNVFVGYQAGYYETGDNKLYIENSNSTIPLIYGEFDNNRIGINENAPSANLHIKQVGAGEEGLAIENDSDTDTWAFEIGANDLSLLFNGSQVGYWDDATGNYVATSDKRLKKDILPLKESVLTKLMRLEVVNYRLQHATEKSQKTLGFIAQDVQTHFPNLVKHREDGYLSLNYDDFGILAIKAIQEQQQMIQEQQEIIKSLEKRIVQLENNE